MDNIQEVIKYTQNTKLLYVEDNQIARDSTLIILDEFFDNIITAINGEDGYLKFKENKDFNLVITDINMPKLDGLEMSSKIRDIDKDIPIVIISAHNESHYLEKSKKLDITEYILKPIVIEQLVKTLKTVVIK